MAHFPKPAAGSWTENWPELGTAPVNYEDSIDPERYKLEQEAIFKKLWLNVGRVERLPRKGSYFTREMPSVGVGTSGDEPVSRSSKAASMTPSQSAIQRTR